MKTTIYISKELLCKLDALARMNKVSRTYIIKASLQKLVECETPSSIKQETLKYQTPRKEKDLWHTLHISFFQTEYEQIFDLRKLFKRSLSLLIASALVKYADSLFKKEVSASDAGFRDCYRLKAYTAITKVTNGIVSFELFWGIPDKKTCDRLDL